MPKIPFAIVGLGFGAHIASELVKDTEGDIELVAVCDADRARADEVALRYRVPAFYSLDDLLADDAIAAVGLFTGPVGRAGLIRKIAAAGKHIMTTKPLEINSVAAIEAIREAREQGVVVHLNSPSPTLAAEWRQIVAWKGQFNLGRPVACRRDVWASYREEPDGSWYDDPELCPVAPVFRLGIYLINDLVRLFGEAESVTVLQSRIFTKRPTADNAQIGILFKNGALANIFASFCIGDGDNYRNTITLNFENGTIYGNVGPERTDAGYSLALVKKVDNERTVVERAETTAGSGSYEWATFARAIRGEEIDDLTPEEMAAGIRIIEAMKLAEKMGGCVTVVPLPANAEQISSTADAGAAQT